MEIECIKNLKELKEAYEFVDRYLLKSNQHPRDLNWYMIKLTEHPELMLKATDNNAIVGVLLGNVEDDHVLIGELVVHPDYRGQKIGSRLIKALERNSQVTGVKTFLLGAREGAEGFYLKLGYIPKLFLQIQGEKARDSLDNFIKTIPSAYSVSWREDKNGESKAVIETQALDKAFQQRAKMLPNSYTQYLFSKTKV